MTRSENINRYAYLLLLISLTACSGRSGSGTTVTATGSTPTPAPAEQRIIDNEDLTPGLKGFDVNNNGIRDDIERLIAQKYSATPELKRAAEQEARALQKSMESITRQQALAAGDEIRRAGACTAKVLLGNTAPNEKLFISISKEIAALTSNTRERFTAYWNAESLAGGGVFRQPDEPVCD
jgi:hypothetical protein